MSARNNHCSALLLCNVYLIMMEDVQWKASEAARAVVSSASLMTLLKSDHLE
jgi:hypothetical protein